MAFLFLVPMFGQAQKKKKAPAKTATVSPTKKTETASGGNVPSPGTQNTTGSGILSGLAGKFSAADVSVGLKEALQVSAKNAAAKLSQTDGFFGNQLLKILMPPEAVKAEATLRKYGFGNQVDNAVLSMNRAAEDASKSAVPVFVDAITSMSFSDALGILKGSDTAATGYLRSKTTEQLTTAFRPIIQQSLDKVSATSYWTELTTSYNKIPFVTKINTDLAGYVTDRALQGMFITVAQEEQKIRKDPVSQTTDILKNIFGKP